MQRHGKYGNLHVMHTKQKANLQNVGQLGGLGVNTGAEFPWCYGWIEISVVIYWCYSSGAMYVGAYLPWVAYNTQYNSTLTNT